MSQLSSYAARKAQRRPSRPRRCEQCAKPGATICLRDTHRTTWLHAHCQAAWLLK